MNIQNVERLQDGPYYAGVVGVVYADDSYGNLMTTDTWMAVRNALATLAEYRSQMDWT